MKTAKGSSSFLVPFFITLLLGIAFVSIILSLDRMNNTLSFEEYVIFRTVKPDEKTIELTAFNDTFLINLEKLNKIKQKIFLMEGMIPPNFKSFFESSKLALDEISNLIYDLL